MSANTINPPRGTRDILPNEMRLRNAALDVIVSTYEKFGFARIETPAIEDLNILLKDSSENTKLIFSILKRGEEINKAIDAEKFNELADLGLRYDLTVPLARYFASNRSKLPSVFKSIQIGPVWRAERPQKGRYRQFYQCDIDVLGCGSFYSELELVTASAKVLLKLGLSDFTIHINDRRLLSALISFCGFPSEQTNSIFIILDKLDKIGMDGVKQELNKYFTDQTKIELLLKTITFQEKTDCSHTIKRLQETLRSYLAPNVLDELNVIIEQLNSCSDAKYKCVFNPTLVRGMGYYTGPIFEITHKNSNSSIAGGGRYDKMIGQLINMDVPACGISLGFERLINILSEEQLLASHPLEATAFIYSMEADANIMSKTINELWKSNQNITIYKRQKNFSKQLNDLVATGVTKYIALDANGALSSIREIEYI